MNNNFLYGIHAVMEGIKAGRSIEKIWLLQGMKHEKLTELRKLIKKNKIPSQDVPLSKFKPYSLKNHQGVLAFTSAIELVDYKETILHLFQQGILPFVLILDGVQDVRNFGSIARTALCMGVNLIILPKKHSVIMNADAVKASAGALSHISVAKTNNMKETLYFLKHSGLTLYALSEKAPLPLKETPIHFPLAVIAGNEHKGIRPELLSLCHYKIKIPMKGDFDSLNVSVATGIALYEFASHLT